MTARKCIPEFVLGVSEFEQQTHRIATFLGIEGAQFLEGFSSNAAKKPYISTPSYAQVLEPVNSKAVSRWRPYLKYFEPVLPILRPVADHWGYSLDPE